MNNDYHYDLWRTQVPGEDYTSPIYHEENPLTTGIEGNEDCSGDLRSFKAQVSKRAPNLRVQGV
jgi:hypothetical protein